MIRAKRYSANVYRMLDEDDTQEPNKIVGFAHRMTNGKWAAVSVDDTRLSKVQFETPRKVEAWFNRERARNTPMASAEDVAELGAAIAETQDAQLRAGLARMGVTVQPGESTEDAIARLRRR